MMARSQPSDAMREMFERDADTARRWDFAQALAGRFPYAGHFTVTNENDGNARPIMLQSVTMVGTVARGIQRTDPMADVTVASARSGVFAVYGKVEER